MSMSVMGPALLAATISCATTNEAKSQLFYPDRSELCLEAVIFAGGAYNILFIENEKYESTYATAPEIGRTKGLTPKQSRNIVNVVFAMGSSGASQETVLSAIAGVCMIDGDPDSE